MKLDRVLKILACASFILFLAVSFYTPIEFEDGWWHLSTGRWIVEHKAVPHEDPFSFTEKKAPWVLTQWLGSTSYYLAYLGGGYEGLKVFRVFLFLAIIGFFLYYSRRQLPFPLLILLSYFLFQALQTRCLLRPDVYNYIFIQLFMMQIFAYSRDRNPKRLWIFPWAGCLWGNLHLGSFVFGTLLIGIALFNNAISLFNSYLDKERAKTAANFEDVKIYLAVLVFYLLSLTVSPYGIHALIYAFKVFFVPDFINIYKFVNVVAEALPPTYIFSLKGYWAWGLMIGGAAAIIFTKRERLLSLLIFVFPLFLFLRGRRASAFFALAAVYVIVECARQRSWKKWWASWRYSKAADRIVCAALILFFCVQIVQRRQETVYAQQSLRKESSLYFAYRNPVRAVQFLLDHHVKGKVFTNDVVGGYVIWAGYPKLRPFIDGRQLDQRLFSQYLAIIREGVEKNWEVVDEEHHFDVVLLDTSLGSSYVVASYLSNKDNWQLVFIDGPCLVYVRRGLFKFPADIETLDDRLHAVPFSWEAVRTMQALRTKSYPSTGVKLPLYVDVLDEGATLFGVGFRGEGIRRIIKGFAINPPMAQGVAAGIENVINYEME
jgi:hypothetical protein